VKGASSVLPRVFSAVLAAVCALGLVAAIAGRFDPVRLATGAQVFELQRVVITAPAQKAVASVRAATATN